MHDTLELESRGPGIDPFRASGLKWARKWPKHGFWPHLKNGRKLARKMRKMERKMEKMARKWFENGFSGHFSHFPGYVSTIFQVRPKSMFRPFSSPFRAGGPKWIYTRSTGFQLLRALDSLGGRLAMKPKFSQILASCSFWVPHFLNSLKLNLAEACTLLSLHGIMEVLGVHCWLVLD